jgi:hypothetical protein
MRRGALFTVTILAVFCFLSPVWTATASTLPTPAEARGFDAYTQSRDVVLFLSRLDHGSDKLHIEVVGRSLATDDTRATDLLLCVLSHEGAGQPEDLDRSKPTIFFFASQHGDEQSAKEAALMLIRDLSVGPLAHLLERVNVLVMPQANPYGNLFDQRRNEQDLDQNRDHVKLETPGAQAIHGVFSRWRPEVTVDVHEKGDDYYRMSIGCVSNANVDPDLQAFSRSVLLAEVASALELENVPYHEYLITEPLGVDSSSGAAEEKGDDTPRPMMKRFSTTDINDGRNSLGIYQTLAFIQEGASRADLETLQARTRWQYLSLRFLTESVARHGDEVIQLVQNKRSDVLAHAKTYSPSDLVHLRMEYVRDPAQPELTIKRFVEPDSPVLGVLKVDKKAGESVSANELEPTSQEVEEHVVEHWFPRVEPTLSVPRPLGYVVPGEHQDIVDTLLLHGLHVEVFSANAEIPVEVYSLVQIQRSERDYLAPPVMEVKKTMQVEPIDAGDFYVPCQQFGAQVIPSLLEPQSQYGLIRYFNYDLVPSEGDTYPIYRVTSAVPIDTIPYRHWIR